MPDLMDSTQIACPLCGAKAGTPCVSKEWPHDGPMNHTERHVAYQEQQIAAAEAPST